MIRSGSMPHPLLPLFTGTRRTRNQPLASFFSGQFSGAHILPHHAPSSPPVLLAFAPGPWRWPDVAGSTRYHLWTLSSLGWRVLYIEPPTAIRLRGKLWRASDRPFAALSPGAVAPFAVRLCRELVSAEAHRTLVSRQLAARASSALRQLRWNPAALWLGAPWHSALRAQFAKIPALFHVYDELAASPALSSFQRKLLSRWERKLILDSDRTLCSSLPQLKRRQRITANCQLLENAVPDHFLEQPASVPREFQKSYEKFLQTERPRFCYGGVLDHRVDPGCIRPLLKSLKKGTLCFLGKIDPSAGEAFLAELRQHPKVFLSGAVPFNAYPALYHQADCLFYCHRQNAFTRGMLPEKIGEYLTSGKPIISIATAETQRITRGNSENNLIFLVATPTEFRQAFEQFQIEETDRLSSARIEIAKRRTWSVAAKKLEAILAEITRRHV